MFDIIYISNEKGDKLDKRDSVYKVKGDKKFEGIKFI